MGKRVELRVKMLTSGIIAKQNDVTRSRKPRYLNLSNIDKEESAGIGVEKDNDFLVVHELAMFRIPGFPSKAKITVSTSRPPPPSRHFT